MLGWLNPPATAYGAAASAAGRLLVTSDAARFLAATLLGALVAWDIPTSLAVPRLRKPDVLVHHLAMAATALVGSVYLPTHYGLYYMGCPASAPRDPRPRASPRRTTCPGGLSGAVVCRASVASAALAESESRQPGGRTAGLREG